MHIAFAMQQLLEGVLVDPSYTDGRHYSDCLCPECLWELYCLHRWHKPSQRCILFQTVAAMTNDKSTV